MFITKYCKHCTNDFEASLKEHKRGNAHYCSKTCFHDSNRGTKRVEHQPNVACSTCDKPFYRSPGKQAQVRHGYYFCSRLCKEAAQSPSSDKRIEAIMPGHYRLDAPLTAYRALVRRTTGIIRCEECGYDKHPEILQVHHRDRDRHNNTIDNLAVLCPTCHMEDHFVAKDGPFAPGKRKLVDDAD